MQAGGKPETNQAREKKLPADNLIFLGVSKLSINSANNASSKHKP
jgi:hypothetical protein